MKDKTRRKLLKVLLPYAGKFSDRLINEIYRIVREEVALESTPKEEDCGSVSSETREW